MQLVDKALGGDPIVLIRHSTETPPRLNLCKPGAGVCFYRCLIALSSTAYWIRCKLLRAPLPGMDWASTEKGVVMGTMLGLLGLMLGAWAVRSICIKPMGNIKKVTLSLIAGLFFLSAGGIGGTEEDKMPYAIVAMLMGAAAVWYGNRLYNEAAAREERNHNDRSRYP